LRFFLIVLFLFSSLYSQTVKDISNVIGIRENQLIGYGLIVGLAGTGDKSKFTMQSLQNLLRNSYIKIPAGSINSKNIAAVMVTAELPPFSRQGDKIKVKVSSDKEDYNIGQKLQINGEALTFFGPPSANRAYESELIFRSEPFYSENHPNYRFNIPNKILLT
jgi:hypothetical protein